MELYKREDYKACNMEPYTLLYAESISALSNQGSGMCLLSTLNQ